MDPDALRKHITEAAEVYISPGDFLELIIKAGRSDALTLYVTQHLRRGHPNIKKWFIIFKDEGGNFGKKGCIRVRCFICDKVIEMGDYRSRGQNVLTAIKRHQDEEIERLLKR